MDIDTSMRWLVASALAARVPSTWRLSTWAPKEGNYDCLLLHPHPLGTPLAIALNRGGSLVVLHGTDATVISHNPWPDLARGSESVDNLVVSTLHRLEQAAADLASRQPSRAASDASPAPAAIPSDDSQGIINLHVVRVLAELQRQCALYRLPCHVTSAQYWNQGGLEAVAPSDTTPEETTTLTADLAPFSRTAASIRSHELDPATVWLVNLTGNNGHDAAITWSYIEHRDGTQTPLHDKTTDIAERPWQHLTELFGKHLQTVLTSKNLDPDADDPRPPALGIPAALEAFNRKERGLLFAAMTGALTDTEAHGPALHPAKWWAGQLQTATGWHVPAHAWMAVDYHLSWLHAALAWAADTAWPGQLDNYPSTGNDPAALLVTGNQEDADAIHAWTEPGGGPTRIIIVEAKAHTAWSNTQMTSKLARLHLINTTAHQHGLAIEMKVVLASPRPPQQLDTTSWPDIALTDDEPMWTPLPAPGMRLATQRCNPDGQPSATATTWRITGPR